MIYNIYKILTIILSPFINLLMFIRLLKGLEDKKRIKERYGFATIKKPTEKIYWFQCASVGETNSVLLLIDKILKNSNEKIKILLTTGTVTSANMVAKKIKDNKNIIHQYTPIDKYFVIKRFLKYWNPEVLILVESEIWPNMIIQSRKVCKRIMIVNAKMSKKSYGRWKFFNNFRHKIFDAIDICYTQTLFDEYKLMNLGIQATSFLGNLKFGVEKLKVDENYKQQLLTTKERKTLFCVSTHKGEEEKLIQLYNKLKNDFKDLLFVISIRHPNRSNEVFNLIKSNNFNVKRKSKNEKIDDDTNFYLYDEFGEIGTLFDVFDIILMCGSLSKQYGGHTPIEPAQFGKAILTGPYIRNNKSLFIELSKNNACIICHNKENLINDLYNNIKNLMNNENKIIELKNNSLNFSKKYSNIANITAKEILLNINY